jgi:hypothetical protein
MADVWCEDHGFGLALGDANMHVAVDVEDHRL